VTATEIGEQARAARAVVEAALGPDVRTWPWSLPLSRWIDCLLLLEERSA
jgi:hypothetical protein